MRHKCNIYRMILGFMFLVRGCTVGWNLGTPIAQGSEVIPLFHTFRDVWRSNYLSHKSTHAHHQSTGNHCILCDLARHFVSSFFTNLFRLSLYFDLPLYMQTVIHHSIINSTKLQILLYTVYLIFILEKDTINPSQAALLLQQHMNWNQTNLMMVSLLLLSCLGISYLVKLNKKKIFDG